MQYLVSFNIFQCFSFDFWHRVSWYEVRASYILNVLSGFWQSFCQSFESFGPFLSGLFYFWHGYLVRQFMLRVPRNLDWRWLLSFRSLWRQVHTWKKASSLASRKWGMKSSSRTMAWRRWMLCIAEYDECDATLRIGECTANDDASFCIIFPGHPRLPQVEISRKRSWVWGSQGRQKNAECKWMQVNEDSV